MSPPGPTGPIVFVRAEGQVEGLRHCPLQVAFSFYRLSTGGLFTLFLEIDSPRVKSRTGKPVVFENHHNLELEEELKLVTALISKDTMKVCFTASGEHGPCTGYFGMEAPIAAECQQELRRELDQLIEYHKGIPAARRNVQKCIAQYERENPIEETPVLSP